MSDEVLVKKLRRATGWSFVVLPSASSRWVQPLEIRMSEPTREQVFMERGCSCVQDCGGHLQFYKKDAEGCIYWIAKTRGPLVLKECISLCRDMQGRPVKTYHAADGNCLRCENEEK